MLHCFDRYLSSGFIPHPPLVALMKMRTVTRLLSNGSHISFVKVIVAFCGGIDVENVKKIVIWLTWRQKPQQRPTEPLPQLNNRPMLFPLRAPSGVRPPQMQERYQL